MYRGGGGGGGGGLSRDRGNSSLPGNHNGNMNMNMNINNIPFEFRQQQQLGQGQGQLQQNQLLNQINQQRRMDLLTGKRSFNDFQQQQYSYLQRLQQFSQPMTNQNPYLRRSIKQRTTTNNNGIIPSLSPIIDLSSDINLNINSSTRFGVPVYQQPQPQPQPQQQISLLNGYQFNNQTQPQPNRVINPVQNPVEPEEGKIVLTSLEELEKHLLNDDDDAEDASVITNSDWSETFYDLINSEPSPSPSPSLNPVVFAASNVISPSPTSSTSSCCSASVSATGSPNTATTTRQLIVDVATAVSEGNNDVATELLSKLSLIGDKKGNSEQRLAYYIHNALQLRAAPSQNPPQISETTAMYTLFDISPCFKFGLLAANLVMLEAITSAFRGGGKVHIIDFDVGQGAQYVNLLRALADRKGTANDDARVALSITIVQTEFCDPGGVPGSVKDGLLELAERNGIDLKYTCVTRTIDELTRESLGCEEDETIVVNLAFKVYRVPDESVSVENPRDALLRRVRGLSPRAVTLVEQDMNGNTAPFVTRVNEACGYYGALFDSLESTLPRDNLDRCRAEDGLGKKIVNLIGCEGTGRDERCEVFGKWRARMGMAGFELKPISHTVVESMRDKLNSGRGVNPGFTVKEENGGVAFGWNGRNLTASSAWR